MKLNCNSTKLGIIDRDGFLWFVDIEGSGKYIGTELKDVWALEWSIDNPSLVAAMEKNRLYVLKDLVPEEPIINGAYICEFSDLEIKAVMIDEIMRMPELIK